MAVHDSNHHDEPLKRIDDEEMTRLSERVYRAVRMSCPRYLSDQAEDIAQQVMLQLHRQLIKNEEKGVFTSIYLMKAAHGAAVDEIRRRSRRRETPGLEGESMAKAASTPDPERESMARSLGREIRRCLEKLLASRKMAVTLHLLGCSTAEVADRLGCKPKAADNRVYRGMSDLRKCLTDKGLKP